MYVTFKNNSTGAKMIVTVQNQKHIINPESSIDVFVHNESFQFIAETSAMDELIDAVNEIEYNDKNACLKDRILTKLAKKTAQKLPDTVLNTCVNYEVSSTFFQI